MSFAATIFKMESVDPAMLKQPRKELMERVNSAKLDDFQIYTCKDVKVAWLVDSPPKKRSLLARVVLPAVKNGEMFERIINHKALDESLGRDDRRVYHRTSWFLFVAEVEEYSKAVPYNVSFFLPPKEGLTLPRAIQGEYHDCLGPTGILTTPTTVLCVVDYMCSKIISSPAIVCLAARYSLPFVCSFCGVVGDEKMKKCNGCKRAFYCSKECQKQDWLAEHRIACGKMGVIEVANEDEFKTQVALQKERDAKFDTEQPDLV